MIKSPFLQELDTPVFKKNRLRFFVLDLESIHPTINGNKYFKLKYNIEQLKNSGKNKILTFGGAYSNHIYATAAAGKVFGLQTLGIIRGEELHGQSNPVLRAAQKMGMKLKFVTREDYRKRDDDGFLLQLKNEFDDYFILPEGGTNALAVKGCTEILSFIDEPFNWICCACGTGGTLAGIAKGLQKNQSIIGISAIKAESFFEKKIPELMGLPALPDNVKLKHDFHFGGYAKTNQELKTFSADFYTNYRIKIDPVYNSKLFFGVFKLAEEGFFSAGSAIVCINTGGNYSFET